ncbi:hypothetical protein [Cohnella abietis]|uniref:hypothetical protein n=1 Tax=Cohnella abietis TaxID=2507935 RepID=UPI00139023A6|nr:hypothetical protein [Cohnella abietis]
MSWSLLAALLFRLRLVFSALVTGIVSFDLIPYERFSIAWICMAVIFCLRESILLPMD